MTVQPGKRIGGILNRKAGIMEDCLNTERILSAWVGSGGIEASELASLERHCGTCAPCARRTRALLPLMRRDLDSADAALLRDPTPPPAALRTAIMERVVSREARRPASRGIRVPLLAAASLAVAVGLALLAYRAGLAGRASEERGSIVVRFELSAPEARSVYLAGDFTDWQERSMRLHDADGDGVWEVTVRLERGRTYSYNFLVDGEQWIVDPNASVNVDDGFGGLSSVIVL